MVYLCVFPKNVMCIICAYNVFSGTWSQCIVISYPTMIQLYNKLHSASCLHLPSHSATPTIYIYFYLFFVIRSLFFVCLFHNSSLVSSIPGRTICLSSLKDSKQTMLSHIFFFVVSSTTFPLLIRINSTFI